MKRRRSLAMAKVITYECTQCGCEITVNQTGETELMPIYCCGIEVAETMTPARKKLASAKKVTANKAKTAKKVVGKKGASKTTQKKKSAAKKGVKK
jgi:predicted transcriptional regulator